MISHGTDCLEREDSPGELVAVIYPEVLWFTQSSLHSLGVPDLLDKSALRLIRVATPGYLKRC